MEIIYSWFIKNAVQILKVFFWTEPEWKNVYFRIEYGDRLYCLISALLKSLGINKSLAIQNAKNKRYPMQQITIVNIRYVY